MRLTVTRVLCSLSSLMHAEDEPVFNTNDIELPSFILFERESHYFDFDARCTLEEPECREFRK